MKSVRSGRISEEVTLGCGAPPPSFPWGPTWGCPVLLLGEGCFCPFPVGACPMGLLLRVQLGRDWKYRSWPVSQVRCTYDHRDQGTKGLSRGVWG